MNTKLLLSIVITSLVLISCKKELEPQESTATSELVRLGLAKDSTKTTTQTAAVQNPATNPNTVLGSNKGINPAHGQPGHRCDIAVGAPLNSAPTQQGQAAPQTVQVNQGQPQVVTTTTTAPVKTAKGMNPPHGQPGHRCDIAVGAPLNSAPAKAATTQNTSQSGSFSQSISVPAPASNAVPALLSTETETAVADGMNPAHGKPGHRCDIAVGAPLPKS